MLHMVLLSLSTQIKSVLLILALLAAVPAWAEISSDAGTLSSGSGVIGGVDLGGASAAQPAFSQPKPSQRAMPKVDVDVQRLIKESQQKFVENAEGAPKVYPLGKMTVFIDLEHFSGYVAASLRQIWEYESLDKTFYIPEENGDKLQNFAYKGAEKLGEEAELSWDSAGSAFRKHKVRKIPTIVYETPQGQTKTYYDFPSALAALKAAENIIKRR